MALKDLDDTKPRTRDKNWKEDIAHAELPKLDEWYPFRIVGGVFSYAQHWVEFTNKEGQVKRYPVDCANWDPETEAPTAKKGCPACEVGIKASAKYLVNVIDRSAQTKGDPDPIRALDCPPTLMRAIINLKKLNVVKGEPKSVSNPKFGCDIHLQKVKSAKKGVEWQAQKGDRSPITEEEAQLELIAFDELWQEPDVIKIREDLKRHGYFEYKKLEDNSKGRSRLADDEDVVPARQARKRPSQDDDEEDAVPSRRAVAKASKPPVDVDDSEDEDDAPPPPRRRPPVEEDEEESPPPRRASSKKPARVESDDDDDFDSDFDV